jgi:hypothetical protein
MKTDPTRRYVSCVTILSAGHPRVEIGAIVAGPGAVYTVVGDVLVVLERAGRGAELTGPFRVDTPGVAELLAGLEVELGEGSLHPDHGALRTTVDLLTLGLAAPPGCQPDKAPTDVSRASSWDEANADIC